MVIPYGIATLVFILVYLRFVLYLPRSTGVLFVIAGSIFLTGALGIELISANEADINSTESVMYCVLYTIEELFEMLGIAVFIYALLGHMCDEQQTIIIRPAKPQI